MLFAVAPSHLRPFIAPPAYCFRAEEKQEKREDRDRACPGRRRRRSRLSLRKRRAAGLHPKSEGRRLRIFRPGGQSDPRRDASAPNPAARDSARLQGRLDLPVTEWTHPGDGTRRAWPEAIPLS